MSAPTATVIRDGGDIKSLPDVVAILCFSPPGTCAGRRPRLIRPSTLVSTKPPHGESTAVGKYPVGLPRCLGDQEIWCSRRYDLRTRAGR
jgi:hypothetical protein